jgi:hypothetical protein
MNLSLEPQEQTTVGRRIMGVLFYSPQAAFEDIGRQPRWLPPLAIVSITSFLCSLASLPKLKEFTLYTLELQAQTMPELADAAAMDIAVSGLVIFALIAGLFSPAIMCLLYAGLLKLFNLFAGEPAPFRQFFAITVYSYFPIIFAAVIATIMILMSPATHLEEVSTSLYLLFPPPGSTGFAANFARQIDPFLLWSLVLMALGSSVISRAQFKSYAIFLGVLWLLFAVGSAMLGQGVSY